MITSIVYCLLAYLCWWVISRCGLVAAWLYGRPGILSIRHWLILLLGSMPLCLELVSTVLVIMAMGFGVDTKSKKES